MEGIGSEVSHKIREAIKAKLIELGAYVDDELPDYIMVMVANKRTRSQMDEDLQLFLGSNTKIFTSWLHTVLQKLQEVTVATFDGDKKSSSKVKRKRSISSDKSLKKSTEDVSKSKKHNKKHKEAKKAKKNKHKSKDKVKSKSSGKKKTKDEFSGESNKDSDTENEERANKIALGSMSEDKVEKNKEGKKNKYKKPLLNEVVGKAILGNLKDSERLRIEKDNAKGKASSDDEDLLPSKKSLKKTSDVMKDDKHDLSCEDEDVLNIRTEDEKIDDSSDAVSKKKKLVVEDEFNIEPLKPIEKVDELLDEKNRNGEEKKLISSEETRRKQNEMTVSAPTKELLREHDKLISQAEKQETSKEKMEEQKKTESDSDDSLSPEEIRRQLLLSRAKKKLEESKLSKRMKSNSPDILILEKESKVTDKSKPSSPVSRSPPRRIEISRSSQSPLKNSSSSRSPVNQRPKEHFSKSPSSDYRSLSSSPPRRKIDIFRESKLTIVKSSNNEERRKVSVLKNEKTPVTCHRDPEKKDSNDKKKNLISISESLEMEKNLRLKRESEPRKSSEKGASPKKKPVSSRVVTIPEPEAADIPSIVKVKPREFISKDKQANKALILKAVADAEKSIATAPTRNDSDSEIKKPEALFTKDLRGKRFEKLAVTLSNDRATRMISVNSDHSDVLDNKDNDSDGSQGGKKKSELTLKKISNKSDDQFISSKASVKEKNDKYIHCWLEGVEKAVKDDEIVNPNEIEVLNEHTNSDEEQNVNEGESSQKAEARKRKKSSSDEGSVDNGTKSQKLSEKDIANLRLIPNCPSTEDGPQIVVTLDGLNSKTIKDIILRNRDTPIGPLLNSSALKKSNEKDAKEITMAGGKFEKTIKITHKFGNSTDQAGSSGLQGKITCDPKKKGFERISDRFGRINKVNDQQDKLQDSSKNKLASPEESKNKKLIAQLSEKFGKIDREFDDNKKKRYLEGEKKYSYKSRRSERDDSEKDLKYKKSERKSSREAGDYEDLKRMKSKERCMFWPGCSKGTNCEYHHPTSPCKLLPNCKYREKCMYIHPLCKDDLHCRNRDCSYEHTPDKSYKNNSPKESSRRISSSPPRFVSSSSTQICKFYPNCKNMDCRYYHPKKCRYDDECTKPDCKYIHTQRKRPKWSSKS